MGTPVYGPMPFLGVPHWGPVRTGPPPNWDWGIPPNWGFGAAPPPLQTGQAMDGIRCCRYAFCIFTQDFLHFGNACSFSLMPQQQLFHFSKNWTATADSISCTYPLIESLLRLFCSINDKMTSRIIHSIPQLTVFIRWPSNKLVHQNGTQGPLMDGHPIMNIFLHYY